MTEETPNHETFNIIDALQGVDYPEDSVDVFMSDNLMYLISKANDELRLAELRKEEDKVKEIREKLDNLREQASIVKFTFHVRSIPRDQMKAILTKLDNDFPPEKDLMGRDVSNPERDEAFMSRQWAAHIVRIVNPNGAVQVGISEEDAEKLRGHMPQSALEAVQRTMDALYEGAKKGYETSIQDVNFLSGASPEA